MQTLVNTHTATRHDSKGARLKNLSLLCPVPLCDRLSVPLAAPPFRKGGTGNLGNGGL
jgi:hypothetical protein